jgi:signal peptidase I
MSFKKKASIFMLCALPACIFFRVFVGEPCVVPSGSMQPAILPGDRMWIDHATYGALLPRRFADIPLLNAFTWIAPLRRADERLDWGYARMKGLRKPRRGDIAVFQSPEIPHPLVVKRIDSIKHEGGRNYYYMRGDHASNSHDSRAYGYVPDSLIVGTMNVVLYSLDPDRTFPMNIRWNSFLKRIR